MSSKPGVYHDCETVGTVWREKPLRIRGVAYDFKDLKAMSIEQMEALRAVVEESGASDAVCVYALLTSMLTEKRIMA